MAKHWSQMTDDEWKEFERNNPPELFIKNSQFLSNIAETIDNDKYLDGLVKFYNYQLEKVAEFDKTAALSTSSDKAMGL